MNLCSEIFVLNQDYFILSYFDLDEELSDEFVEKGIQNMILHNPVLKQTISQENNKIKLCDIENFDIHKCYAIKYIKNFNIYIKKLLNQPFSEYKFYSLICINKETHKTRIYFKIHHAYADGYKIIDMVNKFVSNDTFPLPEFKRSIATNSVYYYIIGTIMLIVLNILGWIKIILNWFVPAPDNQNKPTDYIIGKTLKLNTIKKFTSKNNITVNDFLYALLVKTDHLYTGKERLIQTMSPINAYSMKEMNNMLPIYNNINNSYDTPSLLKNIHSVFNNYKYSLYIIFVSAYTNMITYMHKHIVSFPIPWMKLFFNMSINSSDYVYTNIIGPPADKINIKLNDIHFLINATNNEIIYNIISYKNNVNIICSFKEGVIQDKKLFQQCMNKAYSELTKI
jgi:hypothetical protein